MIGRHEQILFHEAVSNAAWGTTGATTFASDPIPWGGEPFWIMITRIGATLTGTTPSVTPTLQLSDNGGAWTNVAAGTAISTVTAQASPFAYATIVSSYNNTHTYFLRVLLTVANADNVSPDTSVELISLI